MVFLVDCITINIIISMICGILSSLYEIMDEVNDTSMTIVTEGHPWHWSYQYHDFLTSDGDAIEFDSYIVPDSDLEEGTLRMLEVDNICISDLEKSTLMVDGGSICFSDSQSQPQSSSQSQPVDLTGTPLNPNPEPPRNFNIPFALDPLEPEKAARLKYAIREIDAKNVGIYKDKLIDLYNKQFDAYIDGSLGATTPQSKFQKSSVYSSYWGPNTLHMGSPLSEEFYTRIMGERPITRMGDFKIVNQALHPRFNHTIKVDETNDTVRRLGLSSKDWHDTEGFTRYFTRSGGTKYRARVWETFMWEGTVYKRPVTPSPALLAKLVETSPNPDVRNINLNK